MQSGDTARELLRASATDAAAVRQYLESIDADEVRACAYPRSFWRSPWRFTSNFDVITWPTRFVVLDY